MYEIHIAAPVMPAAKRAKLVAALSAVGITKHKYFYRVLNVAPVEGRTPRKTPRPGRHDLAHPGTMSTVKVESFLDARDLVIAGMGRLAELVIMGNFEVELVVGPRTCAHPTMNAIYEFPGFSMVGDAPAWENHVVWAAPREGLPSMDQVINWFVRELGVAPHQIVDFGREKRPNHATMVSRVATVYQPSQKAILAFAERIHRVKNTLLFRYQVAEQVVLVGEPSS